MQAPGQEDPGGFSTDEDPCDEEDPYWQLRRPALRLTREWQRLLRRNKLWGDTRTVTWAGIAMLRLRLTLAQAESLQAESIIECRILLRVQQRRRVRLEAIICLQIRRRLI